MTPWVAFFHHGPRLVRFGIVGSTGVAINMALLYLLAGIARINAVAASAAATELAIVSNFMLNDRWTFRGAGGAAGWPKRAIRYNLVAIGGLLLSVGTLAVLIGRFGLHYMVANILAIAVATTWSYAANSRLTWLVAAKAEVSCSRQFDRARAEAAE